MNDGKKKFSIGGKIYIFVTLTVIAVAVGTALLSYFISAGQIDRYFKRLTFNSAANFSSLIDTDYFVRLKEVAESDEYQAIRDEAEEADDDEPVISYLQEKGLWEEYTQQRDLLCTYLRNMEDIKYLYIVVTGDKDALVDMYLMDDDDNPVYETGYYEEREPEFIGADFSTIMEPTISHGDWGWLCSAYAPVYDDEGNIICHIGCDVAMDDIMSERFGFFAAVAISTIIFAAIVLAGAIIFARNVIIGPLDRLTTAAGMFKPAKNVTYQEAGVVALNIKNNDEIGDLYNVIRSMQINIIDYLNDLDAMQKDNEKYKDSLEQAENNIKDKDEQLDEMSRHAFRDALTGTGNKASYNNKSRELNENIAAGTAEFAILMVDLNDLKMINDCYGHKSGDAYIIGCSRVICEIYKHSPVYRIGGDEFVVVLQGSDYRNRHSLLEKARTTFAESCENTQIDPSERYSAAIGMAEYAFDDNSVELVFKRADSAMYEEKTNFKKLHGSYR